jgi:peptide deformylase
VSVLAITTIGDPVLRERAKEVTDEELASAEVQAFIEDLIQTKRAAHGAGLAANQVGDLRRIAVVEVEAGNPRYPYKPPFPLTVLVNPELEPLGNETIEVNEGCLSVPDLRGTLPRHAEVRVRFTDRHGERRELDVRGLTAGTFQHEVDHLNGVLFLDRVADPATFSTWKQFERFGRDEFEAQARRIVERYGA